jgi:hypothetical protein
MTLTDTQLVLLSVVGKLLSQGAPPKLQGEQPYAEPLV